MNMTNDYTAFLKRLIAYRTGLQVTQAQLADRLGTTQAAYSKFERGSLTVPNGMLRRLAHMGWDIDYIINGIPRPSAAPDIRGLRCMDAGTGAGQPDPAATDPAAQDILCILAPMLTEAEAQSIHDPGVRAELQLLSLRLSPPRGRTPVLLCRHMLRQPQEALAGTLGLGLKTYRSYERGRPLDAGLAFALGALSGCRASLFLFPETLDWDIVRYAWGMLGGDVRESVQAVLDAYGVFLHVTARGDALP